MRARRLARTSSYDLPLVAIVLALVAIGLAMVYSASGIRALDTVDDPAYYLVLQSAWAALGILGMVAAARVDHRRLRALGLPLVVLSVALLVAVLVPGIGSCAGGACRTAPAGATSSSGLRPRSRKSSRVRPVRRSRS